MANIKVTRIQNTIYALESKGATVKVGGSMPDKFVPNINASRWDDECWLNINHPDSVTTEKEIYDNGKVSLKVGNNTHRMYTLENGDLEYEIEYESRPAYDIETFNLTFPDGLFFAKQLILEEEWKQHNEGVTLEDYLAARIRPDNVINSYAVYWNKKNNQYKTGKFCHIYRPELIDVKGNRSWCDLDIDPVTKQMKISMDRAWLDKAVYPVILDPVLGYDTYGASGYGDDRFYYSDVYETDASGGNIQSFHCSVSTISGSPGVKVAIVEVDQGTGDPSGKDVVEQAELIPSSSNSTVEVVAPFGNLLSALTKYGVCWISDGFTTDVRFDGGFPSIVQAYKNVGSGSYPAAFSDPFPTGFTVVTTSAKRSVWVEYEEAEGVAGIPILRRRMEGY